jgi:hypothetical protein
MLARLERFERTVPGRLLIWCVATPILMAVMALATLGFMIWEYLLNDKPLREVLTR